jgi:hypothetical protein
MALSTDCAARQSAGSAGKIVSRILDLAALAAVFRKMLIEL